MMSSDVSFNLAPFTWSSIHMSLPMTMGKKKGKKKHKKWMAEHEIHFEISDNGNLFGEIVCHAASCSIRDDRGSCAAEQLGAVWGPGVTLTFSGDLLSCYAGTVAALHNGPVEVRKTSGEFGFVWRYPKDTPADLSARYAEGKS